ncbi:MAG: phosphoribosyltransferase family protein [Cyanobacteria bacterium P01_H01_bin.121]
MDGKFRDRQEAGRQLGQALLPYAELAKLVVVGLPRGGVPVAFEVARSLKCPLDICLVRKLGHPRNRELALGAIASGNVRVFNRALIERLNVSAPVLEQIAIQEQAVLAERQACYRQICPARSLSDCHVIVVDDGIATGATIQAAILALQQQQPAQIIVATPIAAPHIAQLFPNAAATVSLMTPDPLQAIGYWYEVFDQVSDEVVCVILQQAACFQVHSDDSATR